MSSALKVQLQGKPIVGITSGFHSQELASGLSTLNSQAGTYRHSYRQEGTTTCQAPQNYHIRNASYVHFVSFVSNLVVSYPESRMSSNDRAPLLASRQMRCSHAKTNMLSSRQEQELRQSIFWEHSGNTKSIWKSNSSLSGHLGCPLCIPVAEEILQEIL